MAWRLTAGRTSPDPGPSSIACDGRRPSIAGMKRPSLALVSLALVLAGCVEGVDENAGGEEIYAAMCARCHGSDLEGGVGNALGSGSALADKPDAYLIASITDGRGRMPAFRSSLTAEQIDRVAAYLREQQAG